MKEEELDSMQELIERKLLMAEVMGGLTSQDKKFIDLWNYAMQLQNNWNELKKWLEELQQEEFDINGFTGVCTEIRINCILEKMQEMEQEKDERSN